MDAVETLNENFLSCSICTDIYKDPCTIGCGHTFCRECLGKFTKTRRDAITAKSILCPVCRQMTKVPNPSKQVEDWTKQFKPSFLIQGLLDTFASRDNATGAPTEHVCFSCQQVGEKTSASFICHDCDVMFCDRCSQLHAAMAGLSSHEISEITGETKVARTRKVICKEHDSVVEFSCRDCNKAVCHKCCIVYHRKCHSVVTIVSMMQEMKEVLQKNRENIQVHQQNTKSTLIQQQSQIKELNQSKTSVQSDIRRVSQQAMDLIKQKEKQLMDELDELTEKQTGPLRGQIKSGEIDLQMYQQYSEFIDQALRTESQMDVYDMYQMCQSGEVTPDMKTPSCIKSPLEKISFKKVFDDRRSGENIQLGHLSVAGWELDQTCTPKLQSTIDIKTKDDQKTPDPRDVTVLMVDGLETLVVTDYSNKSLKSYYSEGCQSQCRSLKLESGPFCVTKLSKNKVAVSFNSHNKFVMVQVTPDLVLHSTVTTQKDYRCLTAIDSSRLAACCKDPPSIDILDLSGKVLRSMTTHNTGLNLIKKPLNMCTTNMGHILVSDDRSVSFYCLTPEGDVVFTYQPTGDREPLSARGITTTDTGDILVADYHNDKIIQLTETGDYVRDILTSRDGIRLPLGICLHQNKLFVTQLQSSVKVFKLMLI